ncbi:MAG: hypothetical protein GXP08_03585 [Gammaproteobacteria bacterium]|nr:hypothetical protein [Gammaproteobacteria bacterium]
MSIFLLSGCNNSSDSNSGSGNDQGNETPVNVAPTIVLAQGLTLTLPDNQLFLDAQVSDDGLPSNNLSYQWEVNSTQAANVTFLSTDSEDTHALFSEAGIYNIQLTVNDGDLSSAAIMTITVNAQTLAGLSQRPDNQTCLAPTQGPVSPSSIKLDKAFPNLPNMGAVVSLLQAPHNSTQWYAVVQSGRILQFDNNALVTETTVFLDISTQVASGGELGLLGMAFHPDYASNGYLYLYYTHNTSSGQLQSKISRFNVINQAWEEQNLLTLNQPYSNHNGGNIAFGPQGYLYIGLGDGGSGNDPQGHGQNTRTLLGAMLRIDVDNGLPYRIPSTNVFVGRALCNTPDTITNAQNCPEIYAWGLRNPWRWSFDNTDGTLWLGDVGQGAREEINIIQPGKNYGWKIMEGTICRPGEKNCETTGLTLPEIDYDHVNGNQSVVGGYVYRGNDYQLSFLHATYLYADTYSGRIWGLRNTETGYINRELAIHNNLIYSFAQANNGDLFVISPTFSAGSGNNIYKIVADSGNDDNTDAATQIPALLSQTGCVNEFDPTLPADGVISYEINSPLWSDNAEKQRFFAIPNEQKIEVTKDGDLVFPVGSVLMKHFLLNSKLIETRLLMRHENTWGGYSYEWFYDNDGNAIDAQLLDNTKTKVIDGQNWLYPSQIQCFECHTQAAAITLGPETRQLNRSKTFNRTGITANQLVTFNTIELFSQTINPILLSEKLFSLHDNLASFQLRAKSYLHSNCSHCHQAGGPAPTDIDLRFTTPFGSMELCNKRPLSNSLGVPDIKLIDPTGTYTNPNSVIPLRMASADTAIRMPPLAVEINHTTAIDVIKNWINDVTACP